MRINSLDLPLRVALAALLLQCFPAGALAATEEPLTTADLLAQVSDPAVISPAVEPVQTAAPASSGFATDQLEQLVAPIALYPDALLTQILMAATYPLEIIEADRWIRNQPDLKGDALDEALKEQDWDPSVKSLTALPTVLNQMSENLDWTQDLGDAFLAQQSELMDTVQIMRGKAWEAGNLDTTEQQTVTQQEDKIIIIEPASPEIIYVPTYSSTVVYGPAWGYPSYYYPYWYRPPLPGYGLVAFGVGVAVGRAVFWGRPGWGWGRSQVNININRQNEFNRNTVNNFDRNRAGSRGEGGNAKWQHDASHRKGVNYSNSDVARQHGAKGGSDRVTRDQARGRSVSNTANRGGTSTQARDRSAATPRANTNTAAANRNRSSGNSGLSGSRSPSTANRSQGNRSSALSGSGSPSRDRMSSSRGASSRGAASFGGSRSGMSRGGGRRR